MNGLRGREGVREEGSPRGGYGLLYLLGEYVAGVATAVLTAVPIHALVDPDWDMVVAMIAGTLLGSAAHLLVLALLGPVVGLFHVMAPGALIGMYGGMLFGMRDSMQAASWSRTLAVAVGLGVLVVAAVQLYDRVLRVDGQARPSRGANP
jgi:hypothetical protein